MFFLESIRSLSPIYESEQLAEGESTLYLWMKEPDPYLTYLDVRREAADNVNNVHYIEDLSPYEIEKKVNDCGDNILIFSKSKMPLNSQDASSFFGRQKGSLLYVIDPLGRLLVADPQNHDRKKIKHSSFLRGKEVLCAGTMKFQNGKLTSITRASGHYRPEPMNLANALHCLQDKYGLNLTKVLVVENHDEHEPAIDYMNEHYCQPPAPPKV